MSDKDENIDNKPNQDSSESDDKTNNPDKGGNTLTDEQWETAFKHPRFKELNEAQKELKQLKAKQEEREEQELKEQNKYKELVSKRDNEIDGLKQQIETNKKANAIMSEAVKSGAVDPETVVKLVDLNSLELDGNTVKGADEAVESLLEEKPYLKGDGKKITMGGDETTTPKGKGDGKPIYKLSELRKKMTDHAWFKEHEDEIEAARKEGRIINDSSGR